MQEPSRFGAGGNAWSARHGRLDGECGLRDETLCAEVIDTELAHLVKAMSKPAGQATRRAPGGGYFPYPDDP
jgi:hypothetical protein